MTDDLSTVTHAELIADVVGIQQTGVPCGLVNRRVEPGYVLANGTVLLESEKDKDGYYIGGAGMDGVYLRTSERYEPLPGLDGKPLAFRRVGPRSVLARLNAQPKQKQERTAHKKSAERDR